MKFFLFRITFGISKNPFEMRALLKGSRNGLIGLLVMAGFVVTVNGGSCREATLCCNGRDSSCVVQKTPINAIIEDLNDKPCYCDHACLKLGDCCSDFKQHCGGKLRVLKLCGINLKARYSASHGGK